MTYQTSSDNLSTTEKLAGRLGQRLRGGEVFALSSDLGGGKTAFTRGLVAGAGSEDHVASPTFTLSREYRTPSGMTIYHFDFYRLDDPGIMTHELAEVIADPQAVVVVEWSGIVENVLPAERIDVLITATGETSRKFTVHYANKFTYIFENEAET